MRVNYSGDKRRRELAAKEKKEAKAAKMAERKANKGKEPVEGQPEGEGAPEEGDAEE